MLVRVSMLNWWLPRAPAQMKLLLWIEELQAELDIRQYDMKKVKRRGRG